MPWVSRRLPQALVYATLQLVGVVARTPAQIERQRYQRFELLGEATGQVASGVHGASPGVRRGADAPQVAHVQPPDASEDAPLVVFDSVGAVTLAARGRLGLLETSIDGRAPQRW